jgi:hypothetical protein
VTRIPSPTIENAADASRPILERMINVSPTGRVLNMHAQMAHSPALLAAYFTSYAESPLDLPASAPAPAAAPAGQE